MLTMDSDRNKQVAKNLELAGMKVSEKQQKLINRRDLNISNVPDNRIIALNKSIEEGCRPAGKLSPLVGKKKISIR